MSLVPENIERLTPYSAGKPIEELRRERGVERVIKLASNENPLGPSPSVIELLQTGASELHRYPDPNGWELRTKLSSMHGVSFESIALGHGSNELIDLLCRAFLTPSDHAVVGTPSFVAYDLALLASNVPFTRVPLRDRWFWNVDDLLAAVTPQTKLLFVANPNNPTGTYLSKRETARLLSELPERVILVMDEAYVEFADANDYDSVLNMSIKRERWIVLRTFSKAYGLAGLRIGYAVGPARLVQYLDRVRAPFNVGQLALRAAVAALEDQDHLRRYIALNQSERKRLTEVLVEAGFEVVPSQANFVLVDVGGSGHTMYEQLLNHGIIVRAMPPPIETTIRITVGLPEENDAMLHALIRLCGTEK